MKSIRRDRFFTEQADAGLKPHIEKRFKVSIAPMFDEKVAEIAGLYLDPPTRVVPLCVDEKAQIKALDRTQPDQGCSATMTHDCKRHGTITLFAPVDVQSVLVIEEFMLRHRAKKFLSFLRRIDRAVKKPGDIHLVLDKHATHKAPEAQALHQKNPRFKLHFTSTSASWLNLVERFFAEITAKRIRFCSYSGVIDHEGAIHDYLLHHNAKPKPFVWSKAVEDVLTGDRRVLDALYQIWGNR